LIDITAMLHTEIPISKEMGIVFKSYNELGLTLSASFKKNINHKSTAFGGSVSTLLILSAWSYITYEMHLRDLQGEIVIQKNETSFLKPIIGDFDALCEHPSSLVIDRFLKTFHKYGKARIKLDARVQSGEETLADFNGLYVVKKL
jgi:thioesterase domain-containing protein